MPKYEKNSPKAIANRIKSKGLQKLRWYCQMCQKQCRDQNGFKCHLMSESHQRQLLLFAENPNAYVGDFSSEFEKGFLQILSRQFGTKRVRANQVYQEYIKDKQHIHMNATRWMTLSGFVQYLGKAGIAKIDHTEKGWYIAWIDREEEERQARLAKKCRMDKDDEERMRELIEKQAQRALEQTGDSEQRQKEYLELRKAEGEKIGFSLNKTTSSGDETNQPSTSAAPVSSGTNPAAGVLIEKTASVFRKPDKRKHSSSGSESEHDRSTSRARSSSKEQDKPKSSLDTLRDEEERRREARNRKDYWLHEGIVVKLTTKRLGEEYYKKKGVVQQVKDNYTAYVRLINEPDEILKLDQAHVETVIPAVGRHVLIVNGAYRGYLAVLDMIDERNFAVDVTIDEGPLKGRKLTAVQYEDVCKLHVSQ